MNTKSNQIIINPEFKDLFNFENEKEKTEYNAQMISYRILSEVERICEERKLKKKDLALKIGTSKSYITQLFRGNKSINTQVMAKFEDVLNITFEIEAHLNEVNEEFLGEKINLDLFANKRTPDNNGTWYYCYTKRDNHTRKNTEEIVKNLKTENSQKQVA